MRGAGVRLVGTADQLMPSHSHRSAIGVASGSPPPCKTTRWRCASYAIMPPDRGGGDVAGLNCVHVVPSHSQVSLPEVTLPRPPNRTTRSRTGSYAICAWSRGDGELVGASFVQVVPSQVQVSSKIPEPPVGRSPTPPNSSVRWRATSYVIA